MNRASLMLAALEDGEWLTRADLFNHARGFYLTNNAASELRALGHNVEQRRYLGNYEYRLCAGEPSVTLPTSTDGLPREVGGAAGPPSSASPAQLTLEAA